MTKKPIIIILLIACFMWLSFIFVEQAGQKVNTLKSISSIAYKIKADLLMLQRHEKDFLSRYDQTYVHHFLNSSKIVQKDIETLNHFLSKLNILPKEGDKLVKIIINYEKTFMGIVDIQKRVGLSPSDEHLALLIKYAHHFEYQLDQIIQNLLDISAMVEYKTHQFTRYMMVVLNLGMLFICIIGIFFVSPLNRPKVFSIFASRMSNKLKRLP